MKSLSEAQMSLAKPQIRKMGQQTRWGYWALSIGAASLVFTGCVPKAKPEEPATAPPEAAPSTQPSQAPNITNAPDRAEEPPTGNDPGPAVGAVPPPGPAPVAVTAQSSFEKAVKALERGGAGNREAVELLEQAVRLEPTFYQAYFNLGVAHQRLGEFAQAEEAYEKATDINSDFIAAYVNLASLMREQGNYEDGLDILSKASRIAPQNSNIRNERVAILRIMGRTDDAIAEAHKLIKDNSNDYHAFVNLALGYWDKGNLDMSRLVFEKAIASFPNVSSDAHARHAYGMVLLQQDERDLAIVTGFDKSLELDPQYVEALVNRAQLHLEDSEPGDAVALLRRAVEKEPNNGAARLTLAVALRRTGDLEAAKSQYEILLTQQPTNFDALYNFAVLYANYLNEPDQAKEKFVLARKYASDDNMVAMLDQYIEEAQRNIDTRERMEKLKRMREQAAREREAKEAAAKAEEEAAGGGGSPGARGYWAGSR